ncbi:MAG: autotransporter-associated beta strand repeat-containing protein [Desulfobulbus sp.]|nr:autotransporter-associated beta strand repeat-containing protein [Desulfobulbus sp.]
MSLFAKENMLPAQYRPDGSPLLTVFFGGLFLALVFFCPAPAIGENVTYNNGPSSLLGDPVIYYPGSNNAANYTPQVGALFPKYSSSNNVVNFINGDIYVANPGSGRTGPAGDVFGGIGDTSRVTYNTVNISGGRVSNVYGGLAAGSGVNLYRNTVNIGNATVMNSVYGGRIILGSNTWAEQNAVTINPGALIYNNVYGAYSAVSGSYLQENGITVNGGEIRGPIISGAYAFISGVDVRANSVTINGGTIRNADIYGGRGQSALANTSTIESNRVTITGGLINENYTGKGIYGGQNITGNGALVRNNRVTISGGTVNADVYGGYNAGNGNTSGNIVNISGGSVAGNIYGGYSRSNGHVFDNSVTISDVAIAGDIYGGYSASGSVTNNTVTYGVTNASDTITYGGAILGASSLSKTGAGTLTLTGDNSNIDGVINIQDGTLQLGNGGTTGSIATSSYFLADTGAALAYQHANDVTETQRIIGPGTVIQRGTGTLTLQNRTNNFTGGTEIESGTLGIINDNLGSVVQSYNQASFSNYRTYGPTSAGYITFTGADTGQEKKVIVDSVGLLTNSFRTQTGAGDENRVDLTAASIWDGTAYTAMIANVFTADRGGAFYVADGTTVNVDVANNLVLAANLTQVASQPQWNDLYVANSGAFNLNLKSALTTFASGIDGEGTLNINGDGTVRLQTMASLPPPPYPQTQIFHMGTTNVGTDNVSGDEQTILSLMRTDTSNPRVTFSNTDAFNLGSGNGFPLSAMLMGDGILTANAINVNSGTLAPTFLPTTAAGTLTLSAPTINLNDFALLYMAYGTQGPLTTDTAGIPNSNNTLLNLVVAPGGLNMGNGAVYFITADGSPFAPGDYLVIHANQSFGAYTPSTLTAYVDGFLLNLNPATGSPRSSGTLSFQLGGDPDADGHMTAGSNNVWFTSNSLNSLSMEWTGGSTTSLRSGGSWESEAFFSSLQTVGGEHEQYFMTGDKVYIAGDNSFAVELPAATLTSKIVVSGLVVGQDTSGVDARSSGQYTIWGNGGITADENTAVGSYVNAGGTDALIPTGMLQKYGDSTLIFTNTGGNFFAKGIELYGGTIVFDRADQLAVGDNQAIAFKRSATLQSNNSKADMALDMPIIVTNDDVTATFQVENSKALQLNGIISGDGALAKTGAGTLTLNGANTYTGGTALYAGRIDVGDDTALGRGPNSALSMYDGTTLGFGADDLNLANNIALVSGIATFDTGSNSGTLAGAISGGGALTKIGTGTLTLAGANTYTGLTEVQEGTLALSGTGTISDTLVLYGQTTFATGGQDVNYLTRLDVRGPASWTGDLNVAGSTMNFYVPADIMETRVSMLTVSGSANIADSTVNMGFTGKNPLLQVGDTITLIDSSGRTGIPVNTIAGRGIQGVSLLYDLELITTNTQLLATVTGRGLTEQTKALPEGFVSGLALINQGGDLVAGEGMAQAMHAVDEKRGYGWGTFGIASGGWSRYDTGSHMDLSSASLMTGLAGTGNLAAGRLTLGPFLEAGNGAYDTYNSFSTATDVHGKGTLYHLGGGILGRMDFVDSGPGHVYTEASFRAGGLHNDYHNNDMRDSQGRRAEYTSNSAYYGLHLATGYIWNINDTSLFDFYGKYFWTRLQGDSVTLSTGDPVEFKDADSSRLRFGGRFAHTVNEGVSPYIGAAWEHEFDGKARATAYGYDIGAPTLRGNTGIAEFGLALNPAKGLPLAIDLGVQGYVGERDGVIGSVHFRYEF